MQRSLGRLDSLGSMGRRARGSWGLGSPDSPGSPGFPGSTASVNFPGPPDSGTCSSGVLSTNIKCVVPYTSGVLTINRKNIGLYSSGVLNSSNVPYMVRYELIVAKRYRGHGLTVPSKAR